MVASLGSSDNVTSRRRKSNTCLNFLSVFTFTLKAPISNSLSRSVASRSRLSCFIALTSFCNFSTSSVKFRTMELVSSCSFAARSRSFSIMSRPLNIVSCSFLSLYSTNFCCSRSASLFLTNSSLSKLCSMASWSSMVSKRCCENAMSSFNFFTSVSLSPIRFLNSSCCRERWASTRRCDSSRWWISNSAKRRSSACMLLNLSASDKIFESYFDSSWSAECTCAASMAFICRRLSRSCAVACCCKVSILVRKFRISSWSCFLASATRWMHSVCMRAESSTICTFREAASAASCWISSSLCWISPLLIITTSLFAGPRPCSSNERPLSRRTKIVPSSPAEMAVRPSDAIRMSKQGPQCRPWSFASIFVSVSERTHKEPVVEAPKTAEPEPSNWIKEFKETVSGSSISSSGMGSQSL
mmetsp:Transcript_70695/g.178236  ORF Transcript_70695/g.178236 Transcript_70695/m.178236 type:complete len:415 (+) Transcript_70695:1079-2323(+)